MRLLSNTLLKARGLKLVDGHRGRDVVAEHEVELRLNQLPRAYLLQPGVAGEDLLRHCHCHETSFPFLQLAASIILLMPLT